MPLFALFIAQFLCDATEILNNATTTAVNDITTTNTTENDDMTKSIIVTTTTTLTTTTPSSTTSKSSSTSTSTTTVPPTITTPAVPSATTPTSPKTQEPKTAISEDELISTPKTPTAAVTCNKTTSLLSESQKFTTLMVFFGLPIGLLLVLVGTLSVALLLVTRKRMKLRKGTYLSESIPFVERVKA